MSFWKVVMPLSATNLFIYPSLYNSAMTAGFAAVGGAISFDGTKSRRSYGSLRDVPSAGVNDGHYQVAALVNAVTYYFSADVWGALGVPYRIYVANGSNVVLSTPVNFTGTGYWQRVTCSYTAGSNASYRLTVAKNNSADTSTFWSDGWMLTTAGSALTYIDGEQPGCSWTSTRFNSTSTLSNQSRAGGQIIDFDTYALAIDYYDGTGMAGVENVVLRYGLLDGGFFQRTKAPPRSFVLSSNMNAAPVEPNPSFQTLLSNRRAFIDTLKYDITAVTQPYTLIFTGGSAINVKIGVVYQDGMGMQYGVGGGFTEQPQLNFLAPDPYWYEDGVFGMTTSGSQTLSGLGNLLLRDNTTGQWSSAGSGTNNPIQTCLWKDNKLYIGGLFTTPFSYLAVWDGTSWSGVGGSAPNNAVYGMCFGPDGSLYITGTFTQVGAMAANRIAKFDGSTWSALTSGGSNGLGPGGTNGNDCIVGPDGMLYVSGAFTTAGSTTCNNIAKWDGTTWSALSSGGSIGLNGFGYSMLTGNDGSLYVGGTFTTAGSTSCNRVAKWDGSVWSSLSTGLNSVVNKIAIGQDGTIYTTGSFTTAGGVPANRVASWNGTSWSALGTGLDNVGYSILPSRNGLVYVGGAFTTAGGLATGPTAAWNGSSWVFIDASTRIWEIRDIAEKSDGSMITFVSSVGVATATVNVTQAITVTGTAKTWPKILFTGPGRVIQLANYTTNDYIFFNLTLNTGEAATLNLSPGNVSFTSSFRGNILGAILPGSSLATFKFLPGVNQVDCYAEVPVNGVQIQWPNRFWSLDGGTN